MTSSNAAVSPRRFVRACFYDCANHGDLENYYELCIKAGGAPVSASPDRSYDEDTEIGWCLVAVHDPKVFNSQIRSLCDLVESVVMIQRPADLAAKEAQMFKPSAPAVARPRPEVPAKPEPAKPAASQAPAPAKPAIPAGAPAAKPATAPAPRSSGALADGLAAGEKVHVVSRFAFLYAWCLSPADMQALTVTNTDPFDGQKGVAEVTSPDGARKLVALTLHLTENKASAAKAKPAKKEDKAAARQALVAQAKADAAQAPADDPTDTKTARAKGTEPAPEAAKPVVNESEPPAPAPQAQVMPPTPKPAAAPAPKAEPAKASGKGAKPRK